MNAPRPNPWLHRYVALTALATLGLICLGGVVTSKGVGMAVPDWPNTYGYNMFFFPISSWVGGVFYEHTHRLWASMVGLLVLILSFWLYGMMSRRLLKWGGVVLFLFGVLTAVAVPQRTHDAIFLLGIGLISAVTSFFWPLNEPASPLLRRLGLVALGAVLIQGLLGGLRVVLDKYGLGVEFGVLHGALAQMFFVVICTLVLLTSAWWSSLAEPSAQQEGWLRYFYLMVTAMILGQLVLGAAMRHQHAGLAIPDFPFAYGKFWPAMDDASVAVYNSQRMETVAYNSITAFQIGLQMAHRIMAGLILVSVVAAFALTRRYLVDIPAVKKLTLCWLGLILLQVFLGAATVWTNKSADIATGHVAVGALTLMVGSILTMISFRLIAPVRLLGRVSNDGSSLPRVPGASMVATNSK